MYEELKLINREVYNKCGFELTDFINDLESKKYGSCSFNLNGKKVQYRVSKITPKKNGQFVTLWKRGDDGVTQPFDVSDSVDFIVITSKLNENFGQFIFPKKVLVAKGIFRSKDFEGKRGIRVYPPWDVPTNQQAAKTQEWQTRYFFNICNVVSVDFESIKDFFNN